MFPATRTRTKRSDDELLWSIDTAAMAIFGFGEDVWIAYSGIPCQSANDPSTWIPGEAAGSMKLAAITKSMISETPIARYRGARFRLGSLSSETLLPFTNPDPLINPFTRPRPFTSPRPLIRPRRLPVSSAGPACGVAGIGAGVAGRGAAVGR